MTVASFARCRCIPLVLVCIEKSAETHDAITSASRLPSASSRGQDGLSNRFASRIDDKFEGTEVDRGELGIPMIANALTSLECYLHAQLSGGDHTIFVGEVAAIRTRAGAPLLYFRSGYREMRD